jgi:hypothetical protein
LREIKIAILLLPLLAIWLIFTGGPVFLMQARPINTHLAVLEEG